VEHPILDGEELTISYSADYRQGALQFKAHMMNAWNFECTCDICKDADLFNKLVEVHRNDATICTLGSEGVIVHL
jgi:hypothetical protein